MLIELSSCIVLTTRPLLGRRRLEFEIIHQSPAKTEEGRSEVQGHLWLQSKFDTCQATRTPIKITTKNKEVGIEVMV